MEMELQRHAWAELQGVSGDAHSLGTDIRELASAASRDAAVEASARVERVAVSQGLLCEASAPLASALVHCLWGCSEYAEDLILGILSDISAAVVDEVDPHVYGPASEAACSEAIRLGYPAYVEILETTDVIDSRTACIDLILMCGLWSEMLRPRSIYFLERALSIEELREHSDVIVNSLDDLRRAR